MDGKNQNELKNKDRPKEGQLTPWQKENSEYLKKQANETQWEKRTEKNADEISKEDELENITIQNDQENSSFKKVNASDKINSASFVDKLPKIMEQRKKTLIRRLTLLISVMGIAALLMIYYVSPFSKLEQVAVVGNNLTNQEDIIQSANFQLNKDIWTQYFGRKVNIEDIKKRNPRVKDVSLQIKKINEFELNVTEYQTIAYSLEDNQYYPVLENGTVLSEVVSEKNESLPVLIDFENDSKLLTDMLDIYYGSDDIIQNNIESIQATPRESNPYSVVLNMKDGNQVIGSIIDLSDKLIYYPDIVAEMTENGIIDMEAGIYSAPYPETTNSSEEIQETQETQYVQDDY